MIAKILLKLWQFIFRYCPIILFACSFYVNPYNNIGHLTNEPNKRFFVSTQENRCVRYSFSYVVDDYPDIIWNISDNDSNQKFTFVIPLSKDEKKLVQYLENKQYVEKSNFKELLCWMLIAISVFWILVSASFCSEWGPYSILYRFVCEDHRFWELGRAYRNMIGCKF